MFGAKIVKYAYCLNCGKVVIFILSSRRRLRVISYQNREVQRWETSSVITIYLNDILGYTSNKEL